MADDVEHERRLTRQGQERKQQLLDHAALLFAERGYAETRVIDIVRAAGVAKGLFYWYFENKEAVFRELVETTRQRMRVEQGVAIEAATDPLGRIRHAVEAAILFMGEQRRLFSMFEVESGQPGLTAVMREGTAIHVADTAEQIRAAIAAGLVEDDDPELLAHAVVGSVGYFSHLHRTGQVSASLPELADFAGRYVVRALAPVREREALTA